MESHSYQMQLKLDLEMSLMRKVKFVQLRELKRAFLQPSS